MEDNEMTEREILALEVAEKFVKLERERDALCAELQAAREDADRLANALRIWRAWTVNIPPAQYSRNAYDAMNYALAKHDELEARSVTTSPTPPQEDK